MSRCRRCYLHRIHNIQVCLTSEVKLGSYKRINILHAAGGRGLIDSPYNQIRGLLFIVGGRGGKRPKGNAYIRIYVSTISQYYIIFTYTYMQMPFGTGILYADVKRVIPRIITVHPITCNTMYACIVHKQTRKQKQFQWTTVFIFLLVS